MNLADDFTTLPEYDNHERVVEIRDDRVGLHGFVAIHRIRDGHPSLGATRLWTYKQESDALRDALRLARLMSFKSALAGLPYGGAKAALVCPPGGIADRAEYFKVYSEKLNELDGVFVTGNDVGVGLPDIDVMKKITPYVIGQGIDSGYFTALGMFYCLEVVQKLVCQGKRMSDCRFAIQGLGKTGMAFFDLLVGNGAQNINVCDVDSQKEVTAQKSLSGVHVVAPDALFTQSVDVLSPCAMGGVITNRTIDTLRCRAIIGSANNQLVDSNLHQALYEKGVIYCPDYLVNAGGIISVVDQFENIIHDEERIKHKISAIAKTLERILVQSREENVSPQTVADELALQAVAA